MNNSWQDLLKKHPFASHLFYLFAACGGLLLYVFVISPLMRGQSSHENVPHQTLTTSPTPILVSSPTPTEGITPIHTGKTIPSIYCGHVQLLGNPAPEIVAKEQQAEDCFWQAYQMCQPATLTYGVTHIDVGLSENYTIIPDSTGKCMISVEGDAGAALNSTHYTYTCAVVKQDPQKDPQNGLLLTSCGNGKVMYMDMHINLKPNDRYPKL